MNMISTRDERKNSLSYTDVLLQGLAPDGGLYVPSEYPAFSKEELQSLENASYEEIATAVKGRLIGDAIPEKVVTELIRDAYKESTFEKEKGSIVPVSQIGENFFCRESLLGTNSVV